MQQRFSTVIIEPTVLKFLQINGMLTTFTLRGDLPHQTMPIFLLTGTFHDTVILCIDIIEFDVHVSFVTDNVEVVMLRLVC